MELCSTYRSHSKSSSDSDSEESDEECAVWKRAVKKPAAGSERAAGLSSNDSGVEEKRGERGRPAKSGERPPPESLASQKRKRNNIWSEVLEDQMMSETLNHCGLRRKPKQSRGEESYDYTLKYQDPRNARDSEGSSDPEDSAEPRQKRFKRMEVEGDHSDVRSRGHRNNLMRTEEFIRLSKEEIETAKKIIKVLSEKKHYIIYRVVKYIGIDKALQLLKMTEQIEENGGMMIMNQARRRTPGGVYFQLLKSDKDVTQQTQDKIFEGEMSPRELKEHYAEIKRRKALAKKEQKKKKSIESEVGAEGETKEAEMVEMEVAPGGIEASAVEDGEILD